jgi:hypothetical protein
VNQVTAELVHRTLLFSRVTVRLRVGGSPVSWY